MILAHWIYNRKEWKEFIRYTRGKSSLLSYLWRPFYFFLNRKIPEIKIMRDQVWMGNDRQLFNTNNHIIASVDLRDEGSLHILAISYRTAVSTPGVTEIK